MITGGIHSPRRRRRPPLIIHLSIQKMTSMKMKICQPLSLSSPPLLACSALLVGVNWLIYIHAVNAGHIADASLGYFINPLVNVILGVVVLRERLGRGELAAVIIAAARSGT